MIDTWIDLSAASGLTLWGVSIYFVKARGGWAALGESVRLALAVGAWTIVSLGLWIASRKPEKS